MKKRVEQGGWTHEVTQRVLPSSRDIAGVSGERGRELYGSHRLHAEALRETRLLNLRRDHFLRLALAPG